MAARREERLREVQATALHDRLKHHFIGEVREVDGLTHKHVVRLKAAGIRTASELTPDAIESVPRISDRARARLKMWRAALEEKYGDEVPDALSPAQERRLQRYVEHRIEDLEAQLARTREKIETQRTERARVEDRLDDMPSLSVGRYVRYLLRLDTLPDQADGPSTPSPREEEEPRDARTPVPDPADDEEDWWEAG
jgi:DNA-binding helix-hairpin-helix protein with protein kinase domain